MKQNKAHTGNNTIREKSAKELFKHLLLVGTDVLTKLEYTLLEEVIINNKTFGELSGILKLTSHRQKSIFENAVKRLCKTLEVTNEKAKAYSSIQKDLAQIKEKIERFEDSVNRQNELSPELKKLLSLPLYKIGFPTRIQNICSYGKINSVADLVKYSKKDFRGLRGCGKDAIDVVEAFLDSKGLSWEMQF